MVWVVVVAGGVLVVCWWCAGGGLGIECGFDMAASHVLWDVEEAPRDEVKIRLGALY